MVHFVGAGCGAEDLITLRGAKLIEQADVIIYAGSLVNAALLKRAKQNCRIYNSAEMTLEEVIKVIFEAEHDELDTVRLHTGDPSLYGVIREQIDILKANGISYDITPGVSAFSGAAAALEAEYTLPEVSQSLIITRAAGRTAVPESESIASFAAHGASMAIYLSAGLTQKLQAELISGGYSPDTPAAIVYKASWPEQKVFRCTVSTIDKTARENGIKNTALIVVGRFLGGEYERSKLYDPDFETAFRKRKDDDA